MKALLLVLTAFFLQSCYTLLYTPSEYSAKGDEAYYPPPEPVVVTVRPHYPYMLAPVTHIELPANAPADNPVARLRNGENANDQIRGESPDQKPGRTRAETGPTNPALAPSNVNEARLRIETEAGNSNDVGTSNANPARLRTSSDRPADNNTQPARTETRERPASQTRQNETARPRPR